MNILIPMAGAGSRFVKAGYTLPKPLIDVCGRTMIERVIDSLNIDAHYIFLIQKKHIKDYNVKIYIEKICNNFTIIEVDGLTEGAACTALLAKNYINNDEPLIIANSDQIVYWNSSQFLTFANQHEGCIPIFFSDSIGNSYVKLKNGFVNEVAEKIVISNLATVGIYHFKQGKMFIMAAEQMINKNIRTNNEFYICPVYNELITNNNITVYPIRKNIPIGTPEQLTYYINNYHKFSLNN